MNATYEIVLASTSVTSEMQDYIQKLETLTDHIHLSQNVTLLLSLNLLKMALFYRLYLVHFAIVLFVTCSLSSSLFIHRYSSLIWNWTKFPRQPLHNEQPIALYFSCFLSPFSPFLFLLLIEKNRKNWYAILANIILTRGIERWNMRVQMTDTFQFPRNGYFKAISPVFTLTLFIKKLPWNHWNGIKCEMQRGKKACQNNANETSPSFANEIISTILEILPTTRRLNQTWSRKFYMGLQCFMLECASVSSWIVDTP